MHAPPRNKHWLALLFAWGCSGGGACGGCLGPIPGGFPPDQRAPDALAVNLSQAGLAKVEQSLAGLIAGQAGSGLAFDVPCTQADQQISVTPIPGLPPVSVTVHIFACDLNHDWACTGADNDPSARPDEPGHGKLCQVAAVFDTLHIVPQQQADGTVLLQTTIQMKVNTGRIPVSVKFPLVCTNLQCTVEYDSDGKPPPASPDLPIALSLALRLDPLSGDILAFDLASLSDIGGAVDADEFHVDTNGGDCSFGCRVVDNGILKDALFKNLQTTLYKQIREGVDKARCMPCGAGGICPQDPVASSCHDGLCYRRYAPTNDPATDVRDCVPTPLGTEGRAAAGQSMAAYGAPPEAVLDIYDVLGGREPRPDGSTDGPPSTKVVAGGLVLGVMGGTAAPSLASCVPQTRFEPRPPAAPADFPAEAAVARQDGQSIAGYEAAVSVSRDYLDKALFEAWRAGLLCLQIDSGTTSMISTAVFRNLLPSLDVVTHGQDAPMAIVLRPHRAPRVVIGRGTTKMVNGEKVPDDPLLTFVWKDLQLDFYAFLEERMTRLFPLTVDLELPLSLDFSQPDAVKPVLAGLAKAITNVRPERGEILAEDPATLGRLVAVVMGMAEPALAGALAPIPIPSASGVTLHVLDARGTVPRPAPDKGFQHLALFAGLDMALQGGGGGCAEAAGGILALVAAMLARRPSTRSHKRTVRPR